MDIRRTIIGLTASASLCTHAAAQWTVTNLHPDGASESRAFATAAEQQVGYARFGGLPHAALWRGTAASWVDLQPAGGESMAFDTDGTQQVGYSYPDAAVWRGTPASLVRLDGGHGTVALAKSGTEVVGYRRVKFDPLPLLWEGTGNPVHLPSPSGFAVPWDISGGVPVGTTHDGGFRAGLWSGAPLSWVSLHPAGAFSSWARGTSGTQHVGYVNIGETRASLWSGTSASSWLNLHPKGSWRHSYALAIHGARQAGYATGTFSRADHACVWSGTSASWVDLHAFLPPEFTDSIAYGIWTGSGKTLVVGSGENSATGRTEALLWTEETCYADCDGNTTLDIFDFLCFQDLFTAGDPAADCDGNIVLDIFDFLCFQDAFTSGCQ